MNQAEGSNHEYHLHHCVLILLRAVIPNAHALVWLLNYHQASYFLPCFSWTDISF